MVLIKDSRNGVFGAFTECAQAHSLQHYGTHFVFSYVHAGGGVRQEHHVSHMEEFVEHVHEHAL